MTPPVATALVATPAVATRPARGGCTGDVGSIVGWWYSGATSPGSQGATFTLDRDARVRADYPRTENHNDPHAPERCVLPRGGQYTLSHAPVEASPGHWWVPYAVGD